MNFIKKEWLYRYKMYRPLEKCIHIMRAIVLFLIVGTIHSFAVTSYSQSTKLTLKAEQATVAEVLSLVEKESQFHFTYNYNQINASRKVSINVKNKLISDILSELFPNGDIGYEIKDRHIALYKIDRMERNESLQRNPQKRQITGIVTDASGQPIIGALSLIHI